MKAGEIFKKTMPFVWAKLLLGLLTVGISIALFGLFLGIGLLIGSGDVTIFMMVLWVASIGVVRFVVMHYLGYLVKAGHIAVITEAVTTGQIPENQVAYGKAQVTKRFATSNIYFVVDKLVSGAVKQIQNGLAKLGGMLDFIPGMSFITNAAQLFIGIFLGYVDECCLGYTFYKKEESAFKSATDGVVIYAQNWKSLAKDAAKTMFIVLLCLVGLVLLLFFPLTYLFNALHWNVFIAFILACILAYSVKFAFIDSYILVSMMVSYMKTAPSTEITFDLYSKLCGVSKKFKQLFEKGNGPAPAYATASAAPPQQPYPGYGSQQSQAPQQPYPGFGSQQSQAPQQPYPNGNNTNGTNY